MAQFLFITGVGALGILSAIARYSKPSSTKTVLGPGCEPDPIDICEKTPVEVGENQLRKIMKDIQPEEGSYRTVRFACPITGREYYFRSIVDKEMMGLPSYTFIRLERDTNGTLNEVHKYEKNICFEHTLRTLLTNGYQHTIL